MPARGWYEWNENEQVRNEGVGKVKQPYFISLPDSDVIAFAGLWAVWQGQDGAQVLSCALLSKTAAPSIAHIHDRMPVVLKPEHFAAWLDPKTQRQDVQERLSDAISDFVSDPASTKVNSTHNDFPELLEPLIGDDLLHVRRHQNPRKHRFSGCLWRWGNRNLAPRHLLADPEPGGRADEALHRLYL